MKALMWMSLGALLVVAYLRMEHQPGETSGRDKTCEDMGQTYKSLGGDRWTCVAK